MKSTSLLACLILSGVSQAAKLYDSTCASVEDCGEPKDPPYYYDWTYKPSSMYTITKLTFIQGSLFSLIYVAKTIQSYRIKNNDKDPDLQGFYDMVKDPKDTFLKNLFWASFINESLWGFSFFLNMLALTGIFPVLAQIWLEHFVSNLEWVANIFTIYLMIDASVGGGYVTLLIFWQIMLWGMTYFFGMGAITFLDRDYPYLDTGLIPSIFYLLGIADHTTQYPFEDVEWPERQEKDLPSEKDDDESNFEGEEEEEEEEEQGNQGGSIDDQDDISIFIA